MVTGAETKVRTSQHSIIGFVDYAHVVFGPDAM